MKNENERGQIKRPPDTANRKHKFGPNRTPDSTHPGRRGIYGQPKKSMGYAEKGQQKPSG